MNRGLHALGACVGRGWWGKAMSRFDQAGDNRSSLAENLRARASRLLVTKSQKRDSTVTYDRGALNQRAWTPTPSSQWLVKWGAGAVKDNRGCKYNRYTSVTDEIAAREDDKMKFRHGKEFAAMKWRPRSGRRSGEGREEIWFGNASQI